MTEVQRCSGGDCPHTMVGRCPGCRREMYAMAVYDFSHGAVLCSCGYKVTPWLRETRAPDPAYLTATAEPTPSPSDDSPTTSPTASAEPR